MNQQRGRGPVQAPYGERKGGGLGNVSASGQRPSGPRQDAAESRLPPSERAAAEGVGQEQTRGYQDLIVWQKAMDLAAAVYKRVKKLSPEELYALSDQMRRVAVSVAANIAEGQSRHDAGEFVRHLSIARGSLAQLETLLLLAKRLGFLTEDDTGSVAASIVSVRQMLLRLIQRLRRGDARERDSVGSNGRPATV
jgi:four helix bundle protein